MVERVERAAGVTLATAPVVVGGGRGVGSAEGFAELEELAALLGGVVGCSRVVTNNGWRNHTDQVGQTGTRIAPEIYIACGISGAIQHWVGAMSSKRILAINTDPAANLVTKADYAVIGDLHEVVPAITAEIRRRARLKDVEQSDLGGQQPGFRTDRRPDRRVDRSPPRLRPFDRSVAIGIVDGRTRGAVAQLVERIHGMDEARGSIPLSSTSSLA